MLNRSTSYPKTNWIVNYLTEMNLANDWCSDVASLAPSSSSETAWRMSNCIKWAQSRPLPAPSLFLLPWPFVRWGRNTKDLNLDLELNPDQRKNERMHSLVARRGCWLGMGSMQKGHTSCSRRTIKIQRLIDFWTTWTSLPVRRGNQLSSIEIQICNKKIILSDMISTTDW